MDGEAQPAAAHISAMDAEVRKISFFSLVLPLYSWSRLLFKTTELRADECAVLLMA